MRKTILLLLCALLALICGCAAPAAGGEIIAATTYPVYQFTAAVAAGTPLQVERVITEPVSCVHDYTLTVNQMKTLSRCRAAVCSGLGLEDFLEDVLPQGRTIDASAGLEVLCTEEEHHDHESHDHDHGEWDPHLWLDPDRAAGMVQNICAGLMALYPEYGEIFAKNADAYSARLVELKAYGAAQLADLSCRDLVTFHDGFGYFAAAFDLHIAAAMEVEAGSEPSARELTHIVRLVEADALPAVFIEASGSSSAAAIVARETGCGLFTLDMAMGQADYFTAMTQNIDSVKEALG